MADISDKPAPEGERLAKVIARAGLCSRRDAEKWIADGRVSVDGRIVTTPAVDVVTGQAILVDGAPLAARHGTRLWLYHKPAGLVVTEKDPEGRPTVFEKLAELGLPRVVTVGRLDLNTEGLLLLTNDGGLKRVLELPSTGWLRKYRVRAFGSIDQARLDSLKQGISVEGVAYGPIEATLERVQGGNVWLVVALREGKNREVKNVLGALGLVVNRLIRVSYGPFQLGELAPGAVTLVKARVLREQLGERLASVAGVDFDSAFPEEATAKPAGRPERNPRDPNARLRPRPERSEKKAPAPRPKTGEPRFAKARAEGKLPPKPQPGRRFDEERPATRRVLFDDGREVVETLAPPRGGGRFGDRERERDAAPRPRSSSAGRPERTRPDGPDRSDRDRTDRGRTERDRPGRGRTERDHAALKGRSDRNRSDRERPSAGRAGGRRKDEERSERGGRERPEKTSGGAARRGSPGATSARPASRSDDAPRGRSARATGYRPGGKPEARSGARPGARFASKPGGKPGTKPGGKPGTAGKRPPPRGKGPRA